MQQWLNTDSGMLQRDKPGCLEYGVNHCRLGGSFSKNFSGERYEPVIDPMMRIKFADELNMMSIDACRGDNVDEWPAPTWSQYYDMLEIAQLFLTSSYENRKNVLVYILGFDEVGIRIEGSSLFFHHSPTEPAEIEFYLKKADEGAVTQISCFHEHRQVKVNIPISTEGIVTIFSKVVGDATKTDYKKMTLNEEQKRIKEQMLLIEKGVSVPDQAYPLEHAVKRPEKRGWIKNILSKIFT